MTLTWPKNIFYRRTGKKSAKAKNMPIYEFTDRTIFNIVVRNTRVMTLFIPQGKLLIPAGNGEYGVFMNDVLYYVGNESIKDNLTLGVIRKLKKVKKKSKRQMRKEFEAQVRLATRDTVERANLLASKAITSMKNMDFDKKGAIVKSKQEKVSCRPLTAAGLKKLHKLAIKIKAADKKRRKK